MYVCIYTYMYIYIHVCIALVLMPARACEHVFSGGADRRHCLDDLTRTTR